MSRAKGTPPPTATNPETAREQMDEALRLLQRMRRTMTAMLDAVETGDAAPTSREVLQKASELEQLARMALGIEARFNEWRERHDGSYLADGAIDFDAVRTQLECRITRLRDCCRDPGDADRSE